MSYEQRTSLVRTCSWTNALVAQERREGLSLHWNAIVFLIFANKKFLAHNAWHLKTRNREKLRKKRILQTWPQEMCFMEVPLRKSIIDRIFIPQLTMRKMQIGVKTVKKLIHIECRIRISIKGALLRLQSEVLCFKMASGQTKLLHFLFANNKSD